MGRPRSLIASMSITQAGKSHNCRHNKNHRINMNDSRLTIADDGDSHHYCLGCATLFLSNDIGRLQALLAQVEGIRGV